MKISPCSSPLAVMSDASYGPQVLSASPMWGMAAKSFVQEWKRLTKATSPAWVWVLVFCIAALSWLRTVWTDLPA